MSPISVLAVAAVLVGCVSGYNIAPPIPVEGTTPGIRYMPASTIPEVTLEIFIDLNCPDSRDGWAILKLVLSRYGSDKLNLVMQQTPLPYHRNAFLCTQGMYVIQNSDVSSYLFAYVEESLSMWANFSTASTIDMSEIEVMSMLGDMANRVTGIDKTTFINQLPTYRASATRAWKFGVRRGVAVTPSYFVNGVELGIGTSVPTFGDWITFLDPIVLP
jgi:hypothetical protein